MTSAKQGGHSTVSARLETPLPLLGHRAQQLGTVQRLYVSLETRRIVLVELTTESRTLQLSGDSIEFDDGIQCFQLIRRRGHHATDAG